MHEFMQVITARQPLVRKMNNCALAVGTYKVSSPCMKKLNLGFYQEIYEILFSSNHISGNMLIVKEMPETIAVKHRIGIRISDWRMILVCITRLHN